MGLGISIGDLAYCLEDDPEGAEWIEEDFEALNECLKSNGLTEHTEPKVLPEIKMSCVTSFPYSFLHHLRRVYALNKLGKPVIPISGKLTKEDDAIIAEVTARMDSHLLCHSDNEGYYVPIEFDDILIDENIAGSVVCSSQKLLTEILSIASFIDIDTSYGEISADMENVLAKANESHPFYVERVVWFALYENAKNSVKHKTIISFG